LTNQGALIVAQQLEQWLSDVVTKCTGQFVILYSVVVNFYGLLGDDFTLVLSWESFNFFLSVLLNNSSVSE